MEIDAPRSIEGGARARAGQPARGDAPGGKAYGFDGPTVRLFIGAGRRDGIRPGDLVGAITGEAGVASHSLGAIQITDRFSLIEVPELLADDIIAAVRGAQLRGKKVTIRRDRAT
jgi:ATP-dependent RNA helicase DeaD